MARRPAVAIVDLGLPDMPGERVAADLRKLHPGLPVLVVSGQDAETMRRRFPGEDRMAFVAKPYAAEGVIQSLARLGVHATPPWQSLYPFMQALAAFLKSSTRPERDAVEARLMALQPFTSRDRYGLFLRAQMGFHRHVEPFYRMPMMADDTHASRLALIEVDLSDLRLPPVRQCREPMVSDLPAAGWLYVAEGSKLGAALPPRSMASP